jgi:succinyl-diaminopimelate desuccinylase
VGDLLAATRDLLAVPSPSGSEAALAGLVEDALGACPWLVVERVGDNVTGRTQLGHGQRVVLAGHLDTVPPVGNGTPRLEGDTLWGVGASDMKGGLAVMLDLATTVREPAVDLTWCFYAREEIGRADSGLLELWQQRPDLLAGDAAILGEPTGALVEAGCQGTMRVRITLRGARAHTARPFTGRNAIHRLAPLLQRVADWPGREVVLDGCTYAEQLQVVAVDGGVAGNVVPDEARVTLNHRYAPDRGAEEAGAFLLDLLRGTWEPEAGDSWEVLDAGDGAPPSLEHPLLRSLVEKSGAPPRAKVGWTDVASFWEHGVPAANFGPGDPLLAHHPDERVSAAQLERARDVLLAVIT